MQFREEMTLRRLGLYTRVTGNHEDIHRPLTTTGGKGYVTVLFPVTDS